MKNIFEYNLNDLEQFFVENNEKKYRAKQLFEWLYNKKVNDYDEMSNLGKDLITWLKKELPNDLLKIKEKQVSKDGTIKYLFELADGNLVETVLMRYDYGNSVCVSSQVGCNMSCAFCASGQLSKVRNLTTHEMVLQVMMIQQELSQNDERVSHVVVMGIGEPFDNYDNVLKFIRIINNPYGLAIGARHITISTCGLIDGIKKFQEEELQVNLAVSLHSAIDSKRSQIMPVNKVYDLDALRRVLKEYIAITSRRVTFEYIVLKGVNDTKDDVLALKNYLKGVNAYLNLIPYNSVEDSEFKNISRDECFNFYDMLKQYNINVTIRREFGRDIDAACGQLRSKRDGK